MYPQSALKGFWAETKPSLGLFGSKRYLALLSQVLEISEQERFERSFLQPKSKGGFRTITPARFELKVIHWILNRWIDREGFPMHDYLYKGGVLPAARSHLGAQGAVLVDLSDAFSQITKQMIFLRFQTLLSWPKEQLEILAELVTYHGYLPQGCSTSPRVFNVVFAPIDESLTHLSRRFEIHSITRYVDDICISTVYSERNHLEDIRSAAIAVLKRAGFKGRARVAAFPPINYLGVGIYPKHVELDADKYREVTSDLQKAIESKKPSQARRSVIGTWNWVLRVYGTNHVPDELLDLFRQFFEKAGPIPAKLRDILFQRKL